MNKQQQEIEDYILDVMPQEQRLAFGDKLAKDAHLREAYEQELIARAFLKEAGRLDLKNTLEGFEMEGDRKISEKKVIPLWVKRIIPLAASIVIFIGVYQFLKVKTISSSEVFLEYFEAYEAPAVMRSTEDIEVVSWKKGAALYRQKKYKEALSNFLIAQDSIPPYLAAYYQAMARLNLASPQYREAVVSLDKVLDSDNDYRQQAQWYKALSYLGLGDKEAAFDVLNSIVESQSYKYREAQEILSLSLKN